MATARILIDGTTVEMDTLPVYSRFNSLEDIGEEFPFPDVTPEDTGLMQGVERIVPELADPELFLAGGLTRLLVGLSASELASVARLRKNFPGKSIEERVSYLQRAAISSGHVPKHILAAAYACETYSPHVVNYVLYALSNGDVQD